MHACGTSVSMHHVVARAPSTSIILAEGVSEVPTSPSCTGMPFMHADMPFMHADVPFMHADVPFSPVDAIRSDPT
eukprot:351205-Chlamydomonas_euryale.AAC.1